MPSVFRVFLIAIAIGLLAPASQSQTFSAFLNGPSESPANSSLGTGNAIITFNSATNMMDVHVVFSGLTGTTTASHIHSATALPFTGTAGVATQVPTFSGFPLGVTSGTYDNAFNMLDLASYNPAFVTANGGTAASAEAALLSGMLSGKAYLNIHTNTSPSGEIRGFLITPEPGTVALFGGLGITGIGALLRRRKMLR